MIETTTQPAPTATTSTSADMLHLWSQLNTAEEAQAWVESHLQASRDRIADLLAPSTARSTTETLALYDQAAWHLRMAGSQAHVMFMVHPLAPVRDAAQALSQVVAAEGVKLSLNRDVYKALEKLDAGSGRRRHEVLPRAHTPQLSPRRRRPRRRHPREDSRARRQVHRTRHALRAHRAGRRPQDRSSPIPTSSAASLQTSSSASACANTTASSPPTRPSPSPPTRPSSRP